MAPSLVGSAVDPFCHRPACSPEQPTWESECPIRHALRSPVSPKFLVDLLVALPHQVAGTAWPLSHLLIPHHSSCRVGVHGCCPHFTDGYMEAEMVIAVLSVLLSKRPQHPALDVVLQPATLPFPSFFLGGQQNDTKMRTNAPCQLLLNFSKSASFSAYIIHWWMLLSFLGSVFLCREVYYNFSMVLYGTTGL